jgi:hypothetical protein
MRWKHQIGHGEGEVAADGMMAMRAGTAALEVGNDRQQLVGFAAVGAQQVHLITVNYSQLAVESIIWVEGNGREDESG